jgi:hypothetical protein
MVIKENKVIGKPILGGTFMLRSELSTLTAVDNIDNLFLSRKESMTRI